MEEELLSLLRPVTAEERAILDGPAQVQRELYTSRPEFVVDSGKLLQKGKLITVRPHTRFVHFPKHRHNYVEMVYMCCGTTRHIMGDGNLLELKEGDLLFLNQDAFHEILPAGEDDIAVNFIILPEFFDRSIAMIGQENVLRDFLLSTMADRGEPRYLHIRAQNLLPINNLVENMIWTLFRGDIGVNTINQTTMGLLLLNLTQFADTINQDDPGQQEQRLVFQTLKYIETHYRNGSLSEVATYLDCPEYTLSRLLSRHAKGSFKELQKQRRLQQAAYLLSNTSLSVEEILDAIGYHNSSYFYRCFREKYGCSPAEYRAGSDRS